MAKARKPSTPKPPRAPLPPRNAEKELINLEMQGDRLKVFSLQTLLTNKRSPETRDTAKLGDVLLPWFEKIVTKPAEKLDDVIELWLSLVPGSLKEHTRLVGFNRGTLSVAAQSATTRAELDAQLRGGLLRALQTGSRGAIFKVKTSVQALNDPYAAH